MILTKAQRASFLEIVWSYYAQYARSGLPWRQPEPDGRFDPYKILVSELMLQQTQVARVVPKYNEFLHRFPTVEKLAAAELGDVLRTWQSLGYNRRAKYLWQAAMQIAADGWPSNLTALSGVGVNTAGAVRAYAFNEPAIFIETNIRTVIIHSFFNDAEATPDTQITDCLEKVIDRENPRGFYWALMDYGSYIKAKHGNASKRSKQYSKQSAFVGSKRQIRGAVIRVLTGKPHTFSELADIVADDRLTGVLEDLAAEGLIQKQQDLYSL